MDLEYLLTDKGRRACFSNDEKRCLEWHNVDPESLRQIAATTLEYQASLDIAITKERGKEECLVELGTRHVQMKDLMQP